MKQSTVLVVDDSPTMRKKIGMAVASLGHTVLFAEGGEAALQISSQRTIDVILLDIVMPEMDGFEVLQRLKDNPRTQMIPVIIISGVEDRMSSIVRAIKLGAEDFLPKDFERVLLNARISACISKKRLKDLETDYLRLMLDWIPAAPVH
jgi:PleD family two-component response regulator